MEEEFFKFLGEIMGKSGEGYWELRILVDDKTRERLSKEYIRPPRGIYNGKAAYFPVTKPLSVLRYYDNFLADKQWEYPFSVYIGYNKRKEDIGKPSPESNVKEVQYLYLDVDVLHPSNEEDKGRLLKMSPSQIKFQVLRNLPTVENILSKAEIKPTVVVYSGLGFQLGFVLSTPVTIDEGRLLEAKLREWVKRELEIIANKTGQLEMKRWIDPLQDVVRILRFPGSINAKLVQWKIQMHEGIITEEHLEEWFEKYALETGIIKFEPITIDPEIIKNLDVQVQVHRRSSGGNTGDIFDKLTGIINEGYILPDNHPKLPTLPMLQKQFQKWKIKSYDDLEEDIARAFARLFGKNPIGFRNTIFLQISGWLRHRQIHIELAEKLIERTAGLIRDEEAKSRMRSAINSYLPEKQEIAGKTALFATLLAKETGMASNANELDKVKIPAYKLYRIAKAEWLMQRGKIDEKTYWRLVGMPYEEYSEVLKHYKQYMRTAIKIVERLEEVERLLRIVKRIGFYQLGTHAETETPRVIYRPERSKRTLPPKKRKEQTGEEPKKPKPMRSEALF